MADLKLVTLNCRGLGDYEKRKDVFNYLRDKQYSLCCLQDTHFTKDQIKSIRSCWGYEVCMSPGSSNARGVAVLLNNNFEYKIEKEKTDLIGNYIILEIKISQKYTLLLVNIYGPNRDTPEFYTDLEKYIPNIRSNGGVVKGYILFYIQSY